MTVTVSVPFTAVVGTVRVKLTLPEESLVGVGVIVSGEPPKVTVIGEFRQKPVPVIVTDPPGAAL